MFVAHIYSIHSVKSEGNSTVALSAPRKHIVIAIVDNQLKGANLISRTFPAIHLLCAILNGELLIFEGNLSVFTDGLIDRQHSCHDVLVRGFVSAYQIDLILQFFNLIIAAKALY